MSVRRAALHVVLVLSVALAASTAAAMYIPMDIQRVPLARVAQNLRRAMWGEPQEPGGCTVARTYAMAWVLGDTTVPSAGPLETTQWRPTAGSRSGRPNAPCRAGGP
jgi:hypothetical protein